jgi:hypothetical protein
MRGPEGMHGWGDQCSKLPEWFTAVIGAIKRLRMGCRVVLLSC